MAFTTDLATPVGQIRFKIGDDFENDGVRPKKVNFTDEQLAFLYNQEGKHVGRAAAAACEHLANAWAK